MNGIVKTAIISLTLGAMTLATLSTADAGDWRRWHGYHGHHGYHGDDALAAGVVGLAAGALIVGALNSPAPYDEPGYVERRAPVRDYYAGPRVAYEGGVEPWTPEWYRYCDDRYQSFSARTGTFTGYDGAQHFCVAN